MTVIPIGAEVMVMDATSGGVPAFVTAVCIRANEAVTYECVWWSGRERRCEWVNALEVEAAAEQKMMRVGFR